MTTDINRQASRDLTRTASPKVNPLHGLRKISEIYYRNIEHGTFHAPGVEGTARQSAGLQSTLLPSGPLLVGDGELVPACIVASDAPRLQDMYFSGTFVHQLGDQLPKRVFSPFSTTCAADSADLGVHRIAADMKLDTHVCYTAVVITEYTS